MSGANIAHTMACNFILEKRKGKNGELITANVPICADINLKGMRIRYVTGYRVDADRWCDSKIVDESTGEVIRSQKVKKNSYGTKNGSAVAYNFINNDLSIIKSTVLEFEAQLATQPVTKDMVISKLDERIKKVKNSVKEDEDTSFWGLFRKFIATNNVGEGRLKSYENTFNNFQHFERFGWRRKIEFADCTGKMMDAFDRFMATDSNDDGKYNYIPKIKDRPRPKGHNTRIRNMRVLSAFFRWAKKNYKLDIVALDEYRIGTEIYEDPYFLTKEERDRIFESAPASTRLQKIRDMFVFECFVGARISDLQALTKDNISADGNYIEYIADKTIKENPRICRIPLSAKAKAILARYDMPDGKLMPHISQQQYNDGIKELLKSLDISRKVIILDKHTMTQKSVPLYEVISSHNARKTFIASLKKAGKDDSIIGSMSGHIKGSKAFGRYYAVDDEQKEDAIKDIE